MAANPERRQRVEALYRAARERDRAARTAFLNEACSGDKAMRTEVASLLAGDLPGATPQDRPQIATARFKIIRRVGSGGMGVVYEAWDKELDIRTALKMLTGFDPDALYRFKNEFRSLADVSHPNLVALYELFSEQGQWFFSMEYVDGGHFLEVVRPGWQPRSAYGGGSITLAPDEPTLAPGQPAEAGAMDAADHATSGHWDEDRLRSGLGQLIQAVLALHAAGILHRDLKPANVKVTPEGRVVVLDFGLAAHRERLRFGEATAHEGILGTVPYMSPEQARGERTTEAADWYAAGVMLYEALTGRRPFEGPAGQVLHDKQRHEAPLAQNFAADIPGDLNALCDGLLVRDPAQRMTGRQALALLRWDGAELSRIPSAQRSAGEPVFVGREPQLAILRAAFAATRNDAPGVVFVHGKSGIGKSTLVERFLGDLSGRPDVVMLAGRCYEQESMPYKALDSAVDSLARYLARLPRHEAAELMPRDATALAQIFPVLRRVEAIAEAPQRAGSEFDPHELRRRAFAALRELLARLGDRRRVVLYIDDLQWGDVDSASLLKELLRGPEAPRLMLIGSYRDGYQGRSPFLDALGAETFGDSGLERHDLPIGPLTEEETRSLAARLIGSAVDERVGTLARESEGNPYFLLELAGGSQAGGNTLDSVLRDRVTALPEEARRLMEIVAVSGRPLGQREAFIAAQLETQDPKLLVSLRVARLIGGVGNEIECYHDRVRETIIAHLTTATLRQCHLRLAATLESSGGDAENIAIHFEGAGNPDQASRYYTRAAESAAATLAFKHAASLYQHALDLSALEGEDRRRLIVKLAEALGNAGRGLDAARTYQKAAREAKEPEVFALERKVAYWFSASGYVDDGREALEKLLRRVGIYAPSPGLLLPAIALQELQLTLRGLKFRERAEDRIPRKSIDRLDALWDATRSFGIIDVPMAVYTTDRHLLLALKAGETTRIARALTLGAVGAAALPVIGRSRAYTLLAMLEKLAAGTGTSYMKGAVPFTRGFADFLIGGRWKASLADLLNAERIFSDEKCSGVAWEMSTIRIFSLWNLLYLGRYAELRRLAAVYTHDGEERGDLYQATSIGGSTQPFGELSAGRPDQALNMMNESLSRWTRRKYTVQLATSAYIRAWIFLYQGDGAAAWAFLSGEWPALGRHLYLHMSGTRQWLRYTRAQSALAAPRQVAEPAEMLRIAESEARRLDRDPTEYTRPMAQLIRAGCAARRGDLTSAARLLETAAAGLEARDMAMMAEAARWRLGEVLGGERGHALVREAESAMQAEGVKQPANLAAVFVNGFGPRE